MDVTREFDVVLRCPPETVGKLFSTTRLGGYWKRSAIPTLSRAERRAQSLEYRESPPVIPDSDEDMERQSAGDADDEVSPDELDIIGDGHESELLADALALQGAEELALSTCSTYEYLTPEEACAYAF